MNSSWTLKVKFWGVRGSHPTPVARNMGYGGNTTCVEVRLPDGEVIILDAGTGITELAPSLAHDRDLHIFFTHLHWDHLQGLPFFPPLYSPDISLQLYSSSYCGNLKSGLESQMRRPYFPVDFNHAASKCEFVDMRIDEVKIGGARVTPFPVHHPNGAAGFRVEYDGAVLVFVPDREIGDARLDAVFDEHAKGASLLIHDAQYTPSEMRHHKGWGHSTWPDVVEAAGRANAGQLALFHHDPHRDDFALGQIEASAQARFADAFVAREGVTITL